MTFGGIYEAFCQAMLRALHYPYVKVLRKAPSAFGAAV